MREILYRAKAINRDKGEFRTKYNNGDWVFGLITRPYNDMFPTLPMEMRNTSGVSGIEVDYKTVGQYTGLCDKNGNKIFEGDIVCIRYQSGKICYIWDIQLDCGIFGAERTHHKKTRSLDVRFGQLYNLRRLDDDCITMIEIIGNKIDNPELLEEEL